MSNSDKNVYLVTNYQEQDNWRYNYGELVSPERVLLRFNYIPKGSVVFVSGYMLDIEREYHGHDWDVRPITEIWKYIKSQKDEYPEIFPGTMDSLLDIKI
jgi:hypothetical protein